MLKKLHRDHIIKQRICYRAKKIDLFIALEILRDSCVNHNFGRKLRESRLV